MRCFDGVARNAGQFDKAADGVVRVIWRVPERLKQVEAHRLAVEPFGAAGVITLPNARGRSCKGAGAIWPQLHSHVSGKPVTRASVAVKMIGSEVQLD
jgi:hypothetical protein